MSKTRELSEPEQKARKKHDGLTRREFNRTKGKFANHRTKTSSGSFEIVALFDGNPVPQTAPFPNEAAALARFERLSSNPNVHSLRLVENQVGRDSEGKPFMRPVALYTLTRSGQQFVNSRKEAIWRSKSSNSIMSEEAVKKSKLSSDTLEFIGYTYTGGRPWWEARA